MFPGCNVVMKNEPIKTEDIDVVTVELFQHNVVIKCEQDDFPDSSDLINDQNDYARPKTIICSEIEYLTEGNVPFESVIVKEEPKLNFFYDSTTVLDDGNANLFVRNWECYLCKHVPINVIDLRRHIGMHVVDENSLNCGQYDRRFDKQHEATHTNVKPFSCDQCDRRFRLHSYLNRHKSVHKIEKFHCDQCNRKFSHKSTLQQHKLIHSGIKPWACGDCDKKFTDSTTLRRHKQTHSNDRPFICQLCDKRCARKSTLIRHLGTHIGEKSFVCNICSKKFARNSTLNHHKLLHSGEFQFECRKCNRKFVTKSSLNYHLQTHLSGQKPFKCDQCDRSFGMIGNLNQHKKTHEVKTIENLNQHKEMRTMKTIPSISSHLKGSSLENNQKLIHDSPKKSSAIVATSRTTKKKNLVYNPDE